MSKVVAVFGATGAQGGSVVKNLLRDPSLFKVVALTRDVNSEKAKKLGNDVELRSCDFNKPSEVENALKGVDAVFAVTDFWGAHSKEKEIEQGKIMVDAAKKVGVKHFIFSSLENTTKLTGGKRHVDHFDSKAEIEEYLNKSGVPFTVVEPACYYENFKTMVRPGQDGQLEFALPVKSDSKIALFSVDDTGLVVSEVLKNKEKYLNKRIAIVGDHLTPSEVAATLSQQRKEFGKQVRFNYVPEKVFASFGFPGAEEVAYMFAYFDEFGYFAEKITNRDLWEGKAVSSNISTLAQWAKDWKL